MTENCNICNFNNEKSSKSDHISSINHQEKLNHYTQRVWCEDCGKLISDKTRHFQPEKHLLKSQNRQLREDMQSVCQNAK